MHARSPPTPAPPCPAQPRCVRHRAATQSPRPPARGSLGGGSTPCTTQPLSAPTSTQGCCFWDCSVRWGWLADAPKGRGAAWPAAQGESDWADAGARRSHRSQASLQASPARPAARSGTVTVPSPPCLDACPCIAHEMLAAPGRVPQGKEPPGMSPSWDKRYLPCLSLGMLTRSRPVAHPRQEGGSRTRTEVTRYTQPCKSGMQCHRGHQPFLPTGAVGATTGTLRHPGTHSALGG